jgi:hypothetical protein
VRVNGEHSELCPRLVVYDEAGEATHKVRRGPPSRLHARLCRPAHEFADELANAQALPNRLSLHDLPGVRIDLDLDWAIRTVPILRAALATTHASCLLALYSATNELGLVPSIFVRGRRCFERECSLGAFAI